MQAEQVGDHGDGEFGGELEQGGVAVGARVDAERGEPVAQAGRVQRPVGLSAREQPGWVVGEVCCHAGRFSLGQPAARGSISVLLPRPSRGSGVAARLVMWSTVGGTIRAGGCAWSRTRRPAIRSDGVTVSSRRSRRPSVQRSSSSEKYRG
jgi:hypothetical protein